jgi:hypothetical protein
MEAFGLLDVVADDYPLIRAKTTAITLQMGSKVKRDVRINLLLIDLILGKDSRAIPNLHEVGLRPQPFQPRHLRVCAIYFSPGLSVLHRHKVDVDTFRVRECTPEKELRLTIEL